MSLLNWLTDQFYSKTAGLKVLIAVSVKSLGGIELDALSLIKGEQSEQNKPNLDDQAPGLNSFACWVSIDPCQ